MVRKALWLVLAVGLGLVTIAPGGSALAHASQNLAPADLAVASAGQRAEPLQTAMGRPAIVATGVDDFSFDGFDAEYTLGRDSEGRSTLTTIETLVALFPETDQNRGIRRNLPERFQGHPTDLVVISVTDERGNPRPYEEDSEDDIRVLTISGDDYVHGSHTYVIEYEQRNVTAFFADTGRDEFYWDVNGLDWAQPFERVTATVHMDDGLAGALTTHRSAVQGSAGSTRPATISVTDDGRSVAIESVGALAPHQTVSFAIGFEPATFTERDSGFFASPAPTVSALAALVSVGTAVWAFVVRRRQLRDAPGRGIIVPQYEALDGVNVLTSANIVGDVAGRAVAAQLIDLAVRGHVRLLERDAATSLRGDGAAGAAANTVKPSRKAQKSGYVVELLDPTAITDEHEYKLVQAVFGQDPQPGAMRDLTKPDTATTEAIAKLQKRVAADALENELRKPYPAKQVTWLIVVASVAALVGMIFAAIALELDFGSNLPVFTLFGAIAGLVAAIILVSRRPLTARGVAIREHLRGQKMYIKLAEAERLRYLQSPQGAERRPVQRPGGEDAANPLDPADAPRASANPLNPARMVHLYERLLPYAMLFGEEKKWAAELGRLYETSGQQPSWYLGATAFNASNFSSGFSSVSAGLTGAYSSSSSGGSSGASAGGGGGGGGGGGV